MQYLVRGRFLDNPSASPKDIVPLWDKIIHPSHKLLMKWVKDKKITGGCLAGQREVVFILKQRQMNKLVIFYRIYLCGD
jgi:hypothetical protein